MKRNPPIIVMIIFFHQEVYNWKIYDFIHCADREVVMSYGGTIATVKHVSESFEDKAYMEDCFMNFFLKCFKADTAHLKEWFSGQRFVISLHAVISHVVFMI